MAVGAVLTTPVLLLRVGGPYYHDEFPHLRPAELTEVVRNWDDRVLALVDHCNETADPFRSEYRLIHRDGRSWRRH